MYAVIKTGGQQYRVETGQEILVDKLEQLEGETVHFDSVLLISDGETVTIGEPTVDAAKVEARVLEHGRGKKLRIMKFKRRKHHMKQQGHRQYYTKVKVVGITQ